MYSIATLKKLLTEAKDLSKVWNYFFDLMDENILLEGSHPIKDPSQNDVIRQLLVACQESASQQLGRRVTVGGLVFSETPPERLYQGVCTIQHIPLPANIFYFSDIEVGSLIYSRGEQQEMFRFSLTKITDPKMLTKH